jgi:hypothetical protein
MNSPNMQMKIAITDTNIFIDLVYCKLLYKLFGIGVKIHSTINVVDELSEQQAMLTKFIKKKELRIQQIEELTVAEVIRAQP